MARDALLQQASGRRHRKRTTALGLLTALVATAAIAVATAQAATPPAPAYYPVTVHAPKGQENGRWAERVKVAGDLNRDGVNDFWIAVPRYQRDNPSDPSATDTYGRVYAVDGRSLADPLGQKKYPKILYKIHPPEPQKEKNFGFQIENIGDVNNDGTADIVVGTDAQNVPIREGDPAQNTQVCDSAAPKLCHNNQGKAWVFDGKTNQVLYELNNPHPQGSDFHRARFGSRLGKAGDVNGDGASEVLVGASGNDDPAGCSDATGTAPPGCRRAEGEAFMFNGRTGALMRQFNLPPEDDDRRPCNSGCGSFGLTVQGPGDVDGDGTPDQLVGAPSLRVGGNDSQGRMYVFSGASGKAVDDDPIRRIDDPEGHAQAVFGFEDVTPLDPGDINGDGKAEIYGHGFTQAGEGGNNQGKSWVFNGGAGNAEATPVMYEVDNPDRKACKSFGWSMTRERDRTTAGPPVAAGSEDDNPLYIGNDPHHCQGDQRGETNIFHPLTGTRFQPPDPLALPAPWASEVGAPGDLGPNLGWDTASPGDLNGDGLRDFVASAPFTNVCNIRLGTTNREEHKDQGVMIVFVSNPDNDPPPPNDQNPADNVCSEEQTDG